MQMVSSAYFDEKYDYKERDIIRVENGGSRWKYRLITGEMLARRFRDRLPRWQRLLPFCAMTYYRPWVTTSRSIYRWPAVNPIYESIYAPTVILEPCQFSYSKITLPYPSWPRYMPSNNYYLEDCSRVLSRSGDRERILLGIYFLLRSRRRVPND